MQIGWAVESAELDLERREGVANLELKVHEDSLLLAELVKGRSGFLLGKVARDHPTISDIERQQILYSHQSAKCVY